MYPGGISDIQVRVCCFDLAQKPLLTRLKRGGRLPSSACGTEPNNDENSRCIKWLGYGVKLAPELKFFLSLYNYFVKPAPNATSLNAATAKPLMMSSLGALTPELLQLVLPHLRGCYIKNLRLACVSFSRLVQLRLKRVFLSAHPRDIKVLYDIANHSEYRAHVTELIYDDTLFAKDRSTHEQLEADFEEWTNLCDTPPRSIAPRWYERIYDENCESLERIKNSFVQTPETKRISAEYESRLSVGESYGYFLKVVARNDQVIAAEDDLKAFRHALVRFTNLKRVTVTPVAHGIPLRPLYETPMIRDLPYGFIYPIPRSWPHREDPTGASYVPLPWDEEEVENLRAKQKWRGLRLVLEALAHQPHRITEFIAEVNNLPTGLPCRMFDHRRDNPDYDNFVSLLERPGFSRLDLALDVGDQDYDEWPFFRSGLLRDALSKAKDIRHFSLSTGMSFPHTTHEPRKHPSHGLEHFFPLKSLIPVEQWQHLHHFGLSGFIVKRQDLLDFLSIMPALRSVELSLLHFMDLDESSWRELLPDLRDKLDWNQRPSTERPSIKVYLDPGSGHDYTFVDVSREVEDFVYSNGKNPFGEGTSYPGNQVYREDMVGIERFVFKPDKDRPYLHTQHLIDLGLAKADDRTGFWWSGVRFDKPLTPEQRAHYRDFDLRRS